MPPLCHSLEFGSVSALLMENIDLVYHSSRLLSR